MGISRMKLVTVVGPLESFDAVVEDCVIGRQFHPEPATTIMGKVKGLSALDPANPYVEPLRHAERLFAVTEIQPDYAEFSGKTCTISEVEDYLTDLERRFDELREEQDSLERRQVENRQILTQLSYLHGVTVPIEELITMKYTDFRFGRIPREMYNDFRDVIETRNDAFFVVTSEQRDYVYGMYMTPRRLKAAADLFFASLQFERILLSGRLHGSAEEAQAAILRDMEESQARIDGLKQRHAELAEKESPVFLQHYSHLRFMDSVYGIRRFAAHSHDSFYLLGWVPENEMAALDRTLGGKLGKNSVMIAEELDALTDYTPPTKLKNPRFFRPFEPFAAMYGLPAYNEIDPTPLMAIVYPLIFGVMFGDVGHGLMLAVIGALMWKLKKMWMGKVLLYCAASSVAFGFVFGSVFGDEHLIRGFRVLESSETIHLILQITMYAGAALLSLSILLSVVNGFKQKNMEKALFGANSICGLFLYIGIVFTVLPFLGFGQSPLPLPALLVLIALPAVFIFLREPLSRLVERRQQREEEKESPGSFIAANFFELFEVLLSSVTNTVSFLRVGAYAISHASLMTVVYDLARMPDGSHRLAALVAGNLIVVGFEAGLAGIQAMRLQFYEIFGRFYSGAGRRFEPLTIDYKTVK